MGTLGPKYILFGYMDPEGKDRVRSLGLFCSVEFRAQHAGTTSPSESVRACA